MELISKMFFEDLPELKFWSLLVTLNQGQSLQSDLILKLV